MRISDAGVNAVARSMKDLYSLDLTYCTRVTADSVCNLLQVRGDSLAELRLQGCRSLDFAIDPYAPNAASAAAATAGRNRVARHPEGGAAGRSILEAIRSQGDDCCLSVLDAQRCCGSLDEGYPSDEPFVRGMASLGFEQTAGFFSRPARWNSSIQRRLVGLFVSESSKAQAHTVNERAFSED